MSRNSELLFVGHSVSDVLIHVLAQAKKAVEELSESEFRSIDDQVLFDDIYNDHLILPLTLHDENKTMETKDVQIDVSRDPSRFFRDRDVPHHVPGASARVHIPFDGSPLLWNCKPSTFSFSPPSASVVPNRDNTGGELIVTLQTPMDQLRDGSHLGRELDSAIMSMKESTEYIRKDVGNFADKLRSTIQNAISSRRSRLGTQSNLAKVLNIPLHRKIDAPSVEPTKLQRNITRPNPTPKSAQPEAGIREEDYAHILNVIRHEGTSFETRPATFARFGEEELRDNILAHLNGHYLGSASGETFRGKGKTDICIEMDNRAAFVAECKVWGGPGEVIPALDQLLGYLTWRDCKAALVFFNKSVAGFKDIQAKLGETLGASSQKMAQAGAPEGEWRFQFRSKHDPQIVVTVHVFLFNLYCA